ncbi:MAG: hypothetical protein QOD63_16 [Actinomycetota bacterium]|jgi:hypothetical protein|nr:hypothetical protein [Actinomycetota bacterium]
MPVSSEVDEEIARLPRGLGWFGVGLGIAQLAAPDVVNCLIGVQPTEDNRRILRASGKKELAAGLKILTKGEPSVKWLAKVAGYPPDPAQLAGGSTVTVEAVPVAAR